MTLPFTGPLKMSMVNTEMKYSPTAKVKLSDVLVRSMAKKEVGKISMSDLYGKSSKVITKKVFTSSTNWVAPMSTNLILTLTGRGGVGYYGYSYTVGYTLVEVTTTSKFTEPPPSIYTYVIDRSETRTPATASSRVPASYSFSWYTSSPDGLPTEQSQPLYRYTSTSFYKEEETESVPSYYGGDASAFGKTFSGTYGAAAIEGSFTNLTVAPGATYRITVPSGGHITISYEEDSV